MPRSPAARQRRNAKLKARIASPADDHFPRCTVTDPATGKPCRRPTARAARKGLHAFLCRYHQEHAQRHGSTWCKSPSATTLRPYLKAALALIEARRTTDPYIAAAVASLRALMQGAGPVVGAASLRPLPPERRARIALARLREATVRPERLLAIALAVHAFIKDGPASVHRVKEWRIVAIAKAAHRLASGTHRRWELKDDSGKVVQTTEMHAYPRSSGRVLRYLGGMVEKECEWVIERHLAAVLRLKLARYGPHRAATA